MNVPGKPAPRQKIQVGINKNVSPKGHIIDDHVFPSSADYTVRQAIFIHIQQWANERDGRGNSVRKNTIVIENLVPEFWRGWGDHPPEDNDFPP